MNVSRVLLASDFEETLRQLKGVVFILIMLVGFVLSAIAKKRQERQTGRMPLGRDDNEDEEDDVADPGARTTAGPTPQSALEDRVRKFMTELKQGEAPSRPSAAVPPHGTPRTARQQATNPQPMQAAPRGKPLAPPQPPSIHTSVRTGLDVVAPPSAVTTSSETRSSANALGARRPSARAIGSARLAAPSGRFGGVSAREWRRAIVLREVLGPPKALE